MSPYIENPYIVGCPSTVQQLEMFVGRQKIIQPIEKWILEEGSLFFADLEKSMKEFFPNHRRHIMFKKSFFTKHSQLLDFYWDVKIFIHLSVGDPNITFEELEKKFPDKHFYDGLFYIENSNHF